MTTPAGRDRPIFILASGWRTGSTLLQRLLCSHPGVHIWGENRSLCDHLARLYREVLKYQPSSARAEWDFHMKASDAWIANLNPAPDVFLEGIKALLDRYLATPAAERGKPRWGFKEVRHGLEIADFLRLMYPDARFLVLVRHPGNCLASARATQGTWRLFDQVGGPSAFLAHWETTARSFLRTRADAGALLIRYEDLVGSPREAVDRLCAFLNLDSGDLRLQVFDTRRRGWSDDEPYLTDEDREALATSSVWEVARVYGYRAEV